MPHMLLVMEPSGQRESRPLAEGHVLYDRMVAYHVHRGYAPPLSAPEFYAGLEKRFVCRDGQYFLPEQLQEASPVP